MKGLFVVSEGMDAAGKTTSIREAIKNFKDSGLEVLYNKGLKSDGFAGKISKFFPSTLTLLVELLFEDLFFIRPNLRKGNIIIQDRWHYTVLSHNPENWADRILKRIFIPILSKSDILIYFTVDIKERIKRLEKNKGHEDLLRNPTIIEERENRLLELYNNFKGRKKIIDTTDYKEEQTGYKLYRMISSHF